MSLANKMPAEIRDLRYSDSDSVNNYKDLKAEASGSAYGNHTSTKDPGFPLESEILYICNREDSYEGYLMVVWERDGQLYQFEMAHCSCNSYSDAWGDWGCEANKINVQYLKKMPVCNVGPNWTAVCDWIVSNYEG